MAIKVRHEGNLTSRVVGGAGSGAAKRAMESAALVKPHQVQLTHGATAQAHAPSGGHAQLIHAPLGGGGGGAPLIHAPAPTGGGLGGSSRLASGAGGIDGADYKVTGTEQTSRPDNESQWDPGNGGRWIRKWLPGEKEAEALGRKLAVTDPYERAMLDFKNSLGMESNAYNQLLKIAGMPTTATMDKQTPLNAQFKKLYEGILASAKEKAKNAGLDSGVYGVGQQPQNNSGDLKKLIDAISGGSQPAVSSDVSKPAGDIQPESGEENIPEYINGWY